MSSASPCRAPLTQPSPMVASRVLGFTASSLPALLWPDSPSSPSRRTASSPTAPCPLFCSAALSARHAPWRLPWPSHRALRYCPCASSSRAEFSPMLTCLCSSLPCRVVIISYRELDPRCHRASRVLVFVVELRLVRCRSSPYRVCSSSPKFGPTSSTRFGGAHRVLHKYFRLATRTSPMS